MSKQELENRKDERRAILLQNTDMLLRWGTGPYTDASCQAPGRGNAENVGRWVINNTGARLSGIYVCKLVAVGDPHSYAELWKIAEDE